MSCVQTILIARTPHAAERNNIRSATAYEPADGSYKRKEEVRCLKTADFTKTPDFLHLRTAIACSREENAQDKNLNSEHTRYLQVTIGFAAVFDAATHTVVEYITEPIA